MTEIYLNSISDQHKSSIVDKKKAKKVSKEFEKLIMSSLLREMYKDINMFEGDNKLQNDFYKSMLLDETANSMVDNNNGLGISDDILKVLQHVK